MPQKFNAPTIFHSSTILVWATIFDWGIKRLILGKAVHYRWAIPGQGGCFEHKPFRDDVFKVGKVKPALFPD